MIRRAALWASALAFITGVSAAHATPGFPGAMKTHLSLPNTPDCIVCHTSPAGGNGTSTQKFGAAVKSRGTMAYDDASLKTALDAIAAAMIDSNGNGKTDIEDLKAGKNPNLPDVVPGVDGGVNPGPVTPRYGCGANIVQSPADAGGALLGLALLAGARVAFRRRR